MEKIHDLINEESSSIGETLTWVQYLFDRYLHNILYYYFTYINKYSYTIKGRGYK